MSRKIIEKVKKRTTEKKKNVAEVHEEVKSEPTRRMPKVLIGIITICILLGFTSYGVYAGTQKSVKVTLDGKTETVLTHASTVKELFADLNVKIGKYDYISQSTHTKLADNLKVEWVPAVKVTIDIDGVKSEKWTTEETVASFLASEHILVNDQDKVLPDKDSEITDNMLISVGIAFSVHVNNGGVESDIFTTKTTIADFLVANQISLGELDRVDPAPTEALTQAGNVTIVRVEKSQEVVDQAIDFQTIENKDANMNKGTKKVVTEGQTGNLQKVFEIIKENGVEVAKNQISESVTKEKVDKVVAIGTKEEPKPKPSVPSGNSSSTASSSTASSSTVSSSTVSSSPPPASASGDLASASKVLTMQSTAYSYAEPALSGGGGVTATGFSLAANPNAKVVAVDPRVIPLGSKVYVEGYGYATALDTGGAIKGNIIDVHFPTVSQCLSWGRKTVTVYVF